MEKINGTIYNIKFYNEQNHFTIADIESEGHPVTILGNMPKLETGENITAYGVWKEHETFGPQFAVTSIELAPPDDFDSIFHYLSSGLLPGIGEKKAGDILDTFGLNALEIIENDPESLATVKGIGFKTAQKVSEAYREQREERNVVLALQKYGISVNYALKLYQEYGFTAVSIVEKNPYTLIDDIYGIGFKTADAIAEKMGIEPTSPQRIAPAIKYCINEYYKSGNTYVPEEQLIKRCSQLLNMDTEIIHVNLSHMYASEQLYFEQTDEQRRCYLPQMYQWEVETAKNLYRLLENPNDFSHADLDSLINTFQTINHITLDAIQIQAVKSAVQEKICIITGGPGTGKTTIIKAILYILNLVGLKTALCAPTGRAAKRMSETCEQEAQTIHRLLEYTYCEDDLQHIYFNKDADNPLKYDYIIVDEMSMVDLPLMKSLTDAISSNTSLILVGDADQLPPVGPGNILKALIACSYICTVRLNTVFRQTEQSHIVSNAHRINQGKMPDISNTGEDFYFLPVYGQNKILERIKNLFISRPDVLCKYRATDDIQVISPVKKGDAGTISLNQTLQSVLNPPKDTSPQCQAGGYIFREGDKVMQMKNNYTIKCKNIYTHENTTGIYNGDMGYIQKIDMENKKVYCLFQEEKEVLFPLEEMNQLSLAYAITAHKSQGSEFKVVIMPILGGYPGFMSRKLLYTAITRAKEMVILVGESRYIRAMIQNNRDEGRLCALQERLDNIYYENH